MLPETPKKEIRQFIENMVKNSDKNRLSKIDNSPIFDKPIVGFSKITNKSNIPI